MTAALPWSWVLRWIFPPTGKEKVFAVVTDFGLRSNFDESGIHGRSGWCVVAGFVGTVTQWETFEGVWGPYGSQTPFHAREFFSCKPSGEHTGPYEGWSDGRADRYFSALLRAIGDADITPIVSGVDLEAYWSFPFESRRTMTELNSPEAKLRIVGSPSKPYFLPYIEVILNTVLSQARKHPKLGVYFLFDENRHLRRRAEQFYYNIKERAERFNPPVANRMDGIGFGPCHKNLGLQAADLLAYTWRRALSLPDKIRPELRRSMDMFCERPSGGWASIWTRDRMERQLLGRRKKGNVT